MTSWLNLEGKTAVVTGGASGIGKTVAQSFLDNGANVVVCDMNPDEPEFELGGSRGKLLYVVTDVTKAESVTAMVEKAKAAFGKLGRYTRQQRRHQHPVSARGSKGSARQV